MADYHVAGVQHVELAHILLSVYVPRVPKLGAGHAMVLEQVSRTLTTICEGHEGQL